MRSPTLGDYIALVHALLNTIELFVRDFEKENNVQLP